MVTINTYGNLVQNAHSDWVLVLACNPTACPIHIHLKLAVENGDLDALRELQSTLWFSMTSVQNVGQEQWGKEGC